MRLPKIASLALIGWAVLSLAASLRGDDFRIESKVFEGKQKALLSQTTTLFNGGFVYDYLTEPERIAIFDRAHGRFILLDPKRKVKTEIRTDDVLAFTERLQRRAAKSSSDLLKFSASPKFDVQFDEKSGAMTLASPLVTYELKTKKTTTPEAARQYHEFSDWYVRLNSLVNPGTTPPFARMVVDAELATRQLTPTEVRLTLPQRGELRSEHKVMWRLLLRDMDRITKTHNQLTTFRTVDLGEFQQVDISKR